MNLSKSKDISFIQKHKAWNLPNILSALRICTVPLFIVLLLSPNKQLNFITAIVFAAASLTDWLDGYLARKMAVETAFGKFLDPLADKLLVLTCFVMLIPLNRIPAWMVAIIVGREIAVTGLRAIISVEGIVIEASSLGKYKTAFQIASIIALIIHYNFLGINFHTMGTVLLWIALIFTLWSGIDYFGKFFKRISIK